MDETKGTPLPVDDTGEAGMHDADTMGRGE